MVSHDIGHILDANLLAGEHEEGNVSLQVPAHHIVQIGVGVPGDGVTLLVVEGEPAIREDIVGAPGTGIATADGTKVYGAVGLLEAEVLVLTFEIALAAGEGNHIRGIEAVLRVVQGEFADTGLVGMGADGSVRNPHGHPDDTLLRVDAVAHVGSLANQLHDPGFVLVGYGEGLSLRGVAIFVGQVHNDLDGLAGRFGTLQGNVDEGTVVNASGLVFQLRTASPGGLRDNELVLVHVTHGLEGMGNLLYHAQRLIGVPVVDLQGAAGLPVLGGMVVQLSEEGMGIGRIGNQHRAVCRGTAGDDDVGAGTGDGGSQQKRGGSQGEFQERFFHRILGFFDLLRNFVV